jgi:UDP-N-acetylmuramate dehydrogenase
VRFLLRESREAGYPVVVMGDGTNLLFSDDGLRGIAMRIGDLMSSVIVDGCEVVAQAGTWVPCLARRVAKEGLSGLEHIVGIPGRLGGLLVMNGGSRRQSIGTTVTSVRTVDPRGRIRKISVNECGFEYRRSRLQELDEVVVEGRFRLKRGQPGVSRRLMLQILRERNRKFPRKEPNCGSVFKTHPDLYSEVGPPGKVIDILGLKGKRVGDAEVSRRHGNFIVNKGAATSADTLRLIEEVRNTVKNEFGHWLECEVRFVRPSGLVTRADESVDLAL